MCFLSTCVQELIGTGEAAFHIYGINARFIISGCGNRAYPKKEIKWSVAYSRLPMFLLCGSPAAIRDQLLLMVYLF